MIITNENFFEILKHLLPNDSHKSVVGLSGGADSLCLTLLMNEYSKFSKNEIFACIVDHKLRPESSTEIIPIIDILKSRGINYKVLVWEHEKIIGSFENKARIARYNLLYNYCKELGSEFLMTAHHALDQWETFFMRLSKSSSLKGLSAIKPISNFRDIKLIRPMLNFSPEDIKQTLIERFGITNYVKDPSNESLEFERVRWRKSYEVLSKTYKLGLENIGKSIERLRVADDCLNELAQDFEKDIFDGYYINIKKFRNIHLELQIRVLNLIIDRVLNKNRIVSYSLLMRVCFQICQKDFVAINLAGLILRRDYTKNVKIYREERFLNLKGIIPLDKTKLTQ